MESTAARELFPALFATKRRRCRGMRPFAMLRVTLWGQAQCDIMGAGSV